MYCPRKLRDTAFAAAGRPSARQAALQFHSLRSPRPRWISPHSPRPTSTSAAPPVRTESRGLSPLCTPGCRTPSNTAASQARAVLLSPACLLVWVHFVLRRLPLGRSKECSPDSRRAALELQGPESFQTCLLLLRILLLLA